MPCWSFKPRGCVVMKHGSDTNKMFREGTSVINFHIFNYKCVPKVFGSY